MSKKAPPRTVSPRISGAEWAAMQIVWERGSATARDVTDALAADTGWAYTTVKTLLSRLAAKGVLRETMRAHQAVYEPAVARDAAKRTALRDVVDRAFGGLVPMVRFVLEDEEMDPRERAKLRKLLADLDAKDAG